MPYRPSIDPERDLQWLAPVGAVAFIVLALLGSHFRDPIPEPANSSAFGCYESGEHPAILIDEKGMNILGAGTPAIPFSLNWNDEGIFLWPEKRIALTDASSNSQFVIEDRPGNAFIFIEVANGKVYGDVDRTSLDTFQVSTKDHYRVAYRKTAPEHCGPTVSPQP